MHPNEDVAKHFPKMTTPPKNQKQPMGMPPLRLILLKEDIFELNNDEKFSSVRSTKKKKLVVYFHFFILLM